MCFSYGRRGANARFGASPRTQAGFGPGEIVIEDNGQVVFE